MRGVRVLVLAGLYAGGTAGMSFAQGQDAYYYYLLGRHLEGEGDEAGALAALERAAAMDPRSAEVRAEIAGFQFRRSQLTAAEQAAKAALTLAPDNLEANKILGAIAMQAWKAEKSPAARAARGREAVGYLERAAATATTDVNLNYQLGLMYLEVGEPGKSVAVLGRLVDQIPGSPDARRALARAHAAVPDLAAAIRTLQEIADDEPDVLGDLAGYQRQAGLLTEAAATYTRALEASPSDRGLKVRRIDALHQAKEYEQAARFAADAQRQHPTDVQFPWLQARSLSKAGQSARAIEVLESTVKAFPKESGIQLALASSYKDAGREADAERLLRQMLETDPSNPDALNHLGYMLAENGRNLDEAITLVNRALKSEPGNGAYLDSLGWAYFKRGDLAEAEKYLSEAVRQLPDNAEILDHLGDLYARQGRWQEAIDAWTRALKGTEDIDPAAVQKKIEDARSRTPSPR